MGRVLGSFFCKAVLGGAAESWRRQDLHLRQYVLQLRLCEMNMGSWLYVLALTQRQWPEQDDSVHPITADAPFRCTWGTNISRCSAGTVAFHRGLSAKGMRPGQLFVQHMTATSLDSSAMPDILDDAELTFRHHKDRAAR